MEVVSNAPAAKLFKAAFTDWHILAPKLLPEIISDVALLSGDYSPGSIRQINFTSAIPSRYIKERLEYADHENFQKKVTLIEGGGLGEKFESVAMDLKFEARDDGSVVKLVMTYTAVSGVDVADDLKMAGEGIAAMVKAIEGYLLANPSY